MSKNQPYLRFHFCHLQLRLLPGLSLGSNTYIYRIRLRIRCYCRIVAMNNRPQSLFNSGLSQSPNTQDTSENQTTCERSEPWDHLILPHIVHFSWYTRHRHDNMSILFNPPTRSSSSGLRNTCAEGINVACLILRSGIILLRAANIAGNSAPRSSSTCIVSPNIVLIDSRARSSSVGPKPPVITTRSERSHARLKVSTIRPWLSPTCDTK